MRRGTLATGAALLVLMVGAADADAFVRTTTCSTSGGQFACGPGESPIPIAWASGCINYHVNPNVGVGLDSEAIVAAIVDGFEVWNEAECSDLNMVFAGSTDEDRVGFNGSVGFAANANVVMVRSSSWAHQSGVLALTSVTFSPSTGEIVDADIEINAVDFSLTTTTTRVRIDVANTMAHESGHFLGLDHSTVPDSTMFSTAPLGETDKRTLDQDDTNGVCEAYPLGTANTTCLGSPEGFYDSARGGECDSQFFSNCDTSGSPPSDPGGICSISGLGGSAGDGPSGLWLLAVLGLAAFGRRRRSKAALVAIGVVATATAAAPGTADAFVRTQTCSLQGGSSACEPGEQPKSVFWPSGCVTYHINAAGTDDTDRDLANGAIAASFGAWNTPACSGLDLVFAGFTDEERIGYNPFTGPEQNANIVVFRNDSWDYEVGVLALTSVTFRPSSGAILDADIELNGHDYDFTTTSDPQRVIIDVANTVTHEAGHFLGLDHSRVEVSTMFETAPVQELTKRTLDTDDIAGVCDIYPAGAVPTGVCQGAPMGFFSKPLYGPDDGPPPPEARSCGCVTTPAARIPDWPLAALALAAAFGARRLA